MGRQSVRASAGNSVIVRTLHHLAATGGTVISKAIAAQPNTVLASEVGPFIGKPKFMPFDPVVQYLRQIRKRKRTDSETIFADRLRLCLAMAEEDGVSFVMRDYAFIDFLSTPMKTEGTLVKLIDSLGIERRTVATIRHPVDAYLSLVKNNWTKHIDDFEDYCVRSIAFLDAYEGCPLFRYEDFVADANRVVSEMCMAFEMEYSPSWTSKWADIRLTGDSGRKSETIGVRPRREMSAATADEMAASPAFKRLCERSGYRADFAAEAVEMAETALAADPSDASAKRSRDCYTALAAA